MHKAKSINAAGTPGAPPGSSPVLHHTRRAYHHGNLRNALIDAAVALVDLHGAEALTLREAARRAGVSQTAPYRHFADRTALVAAVAADSYLMLLEDLTDAARAAPDERRAALTRVYVRFALENRGRFVVMMSTDPRDDEGLANSRAALGDFFADQFGARTCREAWAGMHGRAALALAGLMHDEE